MKTSNVRLVVGAAALVLGCWACGKTEVAPKVAEAPAPAPIESSAPTTTSAEIPAPQVNVSKEIAQTCDIKFGDVSEAPKFDFDRAEVTQEDTSVLTQVATCLTTGPLKGRALHLVGRADPRGEAEYNMALGSRRADAVRQYLFSLGIDPSNIEVTSRGKLDATGTDEASWARDRRVDIDLK